MSITRLFFFCLVLFLLPNLVFSQTTGKQTTNTDAFSILVSEVAALGNNQNKRAETVANWVRHQSLPTLPWQTLVGLLPLLESLDRMDKKDMSVRWFGCIVAPVDGQYIFEQLRTYHTDGKMKLWINDVLVLDSSGEGTPQDEQDFNLSFRSSPVTLRAGTRAEFRLEYICDMKEVAVSPFASMVFPVAVLLWESETMEQQIVPPAVFRQLVEKQPGLRGEYFADANFARKVGDRIDDAIEFIWDRDAVFNAYHELKKQIVQSLLPRLTNTAFLAEISDGDAVELAEKGLVPLLAATTVTERSALIDAISSQPRLLKEISAKTLADQTQVIFMLPGRFHLDFLIRWSEASEIPAFVPGTMIAGWGTYAINNINPYWRIGQCLGKSQTQELYDIVDQHLQNEDGSCNLGMAYIVISACREHNRLGRVLNCIDEAWVDTELSGDAKASWYLAKAFALETAMQFTIKPGRALPELRQALDVAESDELRARVQQEIVARLLTLGRDEEATEFLATQQSRALVSEEQLILENDPTPVTGFREQYAAAALRRRALSLKHYVDSVKKHQESARLKNDTVQVVRLQNVVSDFESKQQSEKK